MCLTWSLGGGGGGGGRGGEGDGGGGVCAHLVFVVGVSLPALALTGWPYKLLFLLLLHCSTRDPCSVLFKNPVIYQRPFYKSECFFN